MKIAMVITSFCPNISYTQNVRGHIAAMVNFGHSIYNNLLWGNTIILLLIILVCRKSQAGWPASGFNKVGSHGDSRCVSYIHCCTWKYLVRFRFCTFTSTMHSPYSSISAAAHVLCHSIRMRKSVLRPCMDLGLYCTAYCMLHSMII